MDCFICGNPVSNEARCPYCGADLGSYRRIMRASQANYNEGLAKARIRDLSGAAEALSRSLKYNKYNREARNLLGLVYFETGETVRALNEWVISKNFYPEDNPVDGYLASLQNGPNTLDKLNQTAKKYNQALIYARQDSRDLAVIQLKRVIQMNPNMVAARLLLALLYMTDGRYDDAKKEVLAVLKIDSGNTQALLFQQEIRNRQKEQSEGSRKRRKKRAPAELNDAAEIPRAARSGLGGIEGTGGAFLNILVGGIIGLLICMFLIVPNVRQEANALAAEALLDADEKASASAADISALERQIDILQEQLDEYEGKADQRASYENLIQAQMSVTEEDYETAQMMLEGVTVELLASGGQALHTQLTEAVNVYIVETSYENGYQSMQEEDWGNAIEMLGKVVELNEQYMDGDALLYLAQSYAGNGDTVNAANYYNKVIELYPGTRRARTAENALNRLGADETAAQTQSDTSQADTAQTVQPQSAEPAAEPLVDQGLPDGGVE